MSQRNLAGALRLWDGSAILSSTYAPTNSTHKTAIRMAGFVAPQFVGKAAFSLFCTPPKVLSKGSAERRLEEKLAPLARLTRNFANVQRLSPGTLRGINDEIGRICGRPVDELNAGNFLRAARVPALVIHDEQDEEVPISEAKAILDRAGSMAHLMTTNGLGHRRIILMPNVVRAAVRHLSS